VHHSTADWNAKKSGESAHPGAMKSVVLFKDDQAHHEDRRRIWRAAGFSPLSQAIPDRSPRRLLLVHANDVVACLKKSGNKISAVEAHLRSQWTDHVGILYFSGGSSAFPLLEPYGAQKAAFIHHYDDYGKGIDLKEKPFAERVNRVAELWTDSSLPPDWQCLYTSWMDEARDFSSAVYVLGNDVDRVRQVIVKLLRNRNPFDEQGMREANSVTFRAQVVAAKKVGEALAQDLNNDVNIRTLRTACGRFLEETKITDATA
jgi:hypothetical protein